MRKRVETLFADESEVEAMKVALKRVLENHPVKRKEGWSNIDSPGQ